MHQKSICLTVKIMNFTQELSQFQGAILSADNTHTFSELTAKGGNEEEITEVIENLYTFLELGGYLKNGKPNEENITTLRKFAFYIVLNAQLPVLDQMLELEGIDSIIWTINTVPQCLMCEVLWGLKMKQFIHEIISYTTPQLALEVSGAFLENFKYFHPLECLDNLRLLTSACYKTIIRLHLLNEPDVANKATPAYNNFKKCLKYFAEPPNEYKVNALDKDDLYEYFGKRLYSMLLLVMDCIEIFTSKLEVDVPGSDIYLLTYHEGALKTNFETAKVSDLGNNSLSECLNSCHNDMLDECKTLVMDVSLDVFCRWSEIEDYGKTMQQTIGELCYKVSKSLKKISTLSEHVLFDMMKQIARKPDEMEDIINTTEDNVILQKVDAQNEDRKLWIRSLIHKEKLCHSLEFLDVISLNLALFDQEQCHKLYTVLNDYVKQNLENHTYAESLMIKVFHQCSLQTKYMILDEHFSNNNYKDMKPTSDFHNSMIETFNKFIATPDSDLSDVLTLFLQNPKEVYNKIFLLATENKHQVEVMLKVMKMFQKYSNYYYDSEMEPCIITITQDVIHKKLSTIAEEVNFINFICGLKANDILSGSKLLLLIIMANLHQALVTKSIESISFHIKLLKEAFTLEELLEYRAPMLAMLGKVMDVVRWKMNNYSVNGPLALNLTIDLQKTLFQTYNNDIPERERDWLKSKVGNLQPLNMYYYITLWHPPSANYLDAVSGLNGHYMNTDELSSWMSQVMASCSQQEWCELWDSLDRGEEARLELFVVAIGVLTLAERSYRTEQSAACLLYCYRNLVYIIRYKYFKEPLTDSEVKSVIDHIACIVELAKDKPKEELSSLFLPLFAYLSEKEKDYSINYSDYINQNLKGAALANIVNKMFSNGTP